MINTIDFKTKTILLERKNESVSNAYGIAFDIGYSGVKGFSPNSIYCFPSYARKLSGELLNLNVPDKDDILYKDNETGEIWAVGNLAQDLISSDESKDSINSLFGRHRYFSPMFLINARVGLALGMMSNNYDSIGNRPLSIQTGLPPAYLKSDSELLTEALAGEHDFSVKIGNRNWISFKFTLKENDIFIMAQPMGSLFSVTTDHFGRPTSNANNYFNARLLILDVGFGTCDIFNIKKVELDSYETFDDLGMKRVFSEAVTEIYKKYKVEIPIHMIQQYLKTGKFRYMDRKEMKSASIPFDEILEEASRKVCMEAIERIKSLYNNLFEHDYLIVTGGTGEAWFPYISDYFAGMETLKVVPGSQNDTLPTIFANVRGYYMYQINRLKRQQK